MEIKSAGEMIKQAQSQINCVNISEARELFKQSNCAVIIDVREAHSASNSKLNDSINISRGLLEMKAPAHCPNPETVILTHCAGGGRASLAALTLPEMGYKNVYAITATYDDIKDAFG